MVPSLPSTASGSDSCRWIVRQPVWPDLLSSLLLVPLFQWPLSRACWPVRSQCVKPLFLCMKSILMLAVSHGSGSHAPFLHSTGLSHLFLMRTLMLHLTDSHSHLRPPARVPFCEVPQWEPVPLTQGSHGSLFTLRWSWLLRDVALSSLAWGTPRGQGSQHIEPCPAQSQYSVLVNVEGITVSFVN